MGLSKLRPLVALSPSALTLLALCLLATVLLAPYPLEADDVYLHNGRVFEGVVAVETDDGVRIRMPSGELTLPHSWVERIERADSVLEEFLSRKGELAARERRAGLSRSGDPRELAEPWLDLALWAQARGLSQGTREAALRAAELDPTLERLEPLMASLDLVRDGETGRFIPRDQWMRRQGFVRSGDRWLTPEQAEARAAAEDRRREAVRQALAEERRERQAERIDRALTLLVLESVESSRREREAAAGVPVLSYVSPYGFPGGVPYRPGGHGGGQGGDPSGDDAPGGGYGIQSPGSLIGTGAGGNGTPYRHGAGQGGAGHGGFTYDNLQGRQPGSLLPLSLDPGTGGRR